jgi:5-methylcytosine-specific restriction endonuclease McrBC regulatory subunit McrC
VPDIVVRRGKSILIVDAKYKAHLAELDEAGWRAASEELRESHRADLHQVLAYASFFDAEETTVSLVYPIRQATWEALRARRQDVWRAEMPTKGRIIRLELRGGSGRLQAT